MEEAEQDDELGRSEALVRDAARRGAISVTTDPQVCADATEHAMACWVDAILRRKPVADWCAWAFRCAANAAKRMGRRRRDGRSMRLSEDVEEPGPSEDRRTDPRTREALRQAILGARRFLRGRQSEVLLKLCEPGMSLHRAARELRMDRSALRRSFQTGMARLSRGLRSTPPHLLEPSTDEHDRSTPRSYLDR